ncbi:DUF6268 family outer membrane beta-barrel protein [Bythopirellula polymerisocia]|uniref:DUF6268 domain-containing protein n=1 Tax=Bythopirellula polymerisocia TaxID=2528003 RepID=A0A5C6D267_9BACT|nr:DUF6268 family outer membrane beta-barrel protein [Bythopirellula polymerisocia]TWU30225.1 hypothetical protein Pla144_10110 [Bythopirellula polymerisocia]
MHRWQIAPILLTAMTSLMGYPTIAAQTAIASDATVSFELSSSIDLESAAEISPVLAESAESRPGPPGGDRSPVSSRAYWFPVQNLRSQPGDWSQAGTELNLAAPLSLKPGNIWLATGNVEYMSINTMAVLPDSQLPVPGELWNIGLGVMNFRELDNGWDSGTIISIGSASDRPFAALRDMTATAIAFVEIPHGERDAWNLSLFYSPTSQLPYPLPGVAYVWRPSETFTANIGVPFSLNYQPTKTFTLTASYFPLTNFDVLAKWQLNDYWSLYSSYRVVNETYWLDERLDKNQRFYLFDQRVSLGARRKLFAGLSLDVWGGYVFDREVFQSESFSDNRQDEISIDPGFLGVVQLSWSR